MRTDRAGCKSWKFNEAEDFAAANATLVLAFVAHRLIIALVEWQRSCFPMVFHRSH